MKQQRGFLMADVISALVLLSTAFVGLIAVSQNTLKLSSTSHHEVTAALVAQSIADRANLKTEQGWVRVDGHIYRWSANVDTNPVSNTMSLSDIRISVTWAKPLGGEQRFELQTARLGGSP